MLKCSKCLGDVKRNGYGRRGEQVYKCKKCGFISNKVVGLDQIDKKVDRQVVQENLNLINKSKVFLITSAQNATPVYEKGMQTLLQIADDRNAQFLIQPYRYRNPNSIFSDKEQNWWVDEVKPYLIDQRANLHSKLVLLGDVKVIPTALNPLRGLHGFTAEESIILGHPKIDMEPVATRQGLLAKLMTTTGAITVQNYTDSGAGKKGIHHHSFGAVIVEIDGSRFHMRHIQIDQDGCAIDLDTKYHPDGTKERADAEALIVPDVHQWWVDKKASNAVFGQKGLVDYVRPKYTIYHDLVDGYSISHHHRDDPFVRYAKHRYKCNNAIKEIEDAAKFVKEKTPSYSTPIIVNSNHHDHIARYIRESDWREDPENAIFYLQTALFMVQNTTIYEGGATSPDPFEYWMEQIAPDVRVLGADESFQLHSYELGMHGHLGPNGARGSPASLSKVGYKKIVGHYHSPCRKNGLLAVGTLSALDREFTSGPSSWCQSAVVLYSNGKASHVNLIDGRFTSKKLPL